MEKIKERINLFYENEFFQLNPGLAEAVVQFELGMGVRLPNQFHIHIMPEYKIGENSVVIGRIHKHFIFGLETEGVPNYQLFETKNKIKLFFTQMEGIEKEDLRYWLDQIDEIPSK